jgi:hypothetical protein
MVDVALDLEGGWRRTVPSRRARVGVALRVGSIFFCPPFSPVGRMEGGGGCFPSLRSSLAGTLRFAFTYRPRLPRRAPPAPTDVTRRDPVGSSWDRWSLAGGALKQTRG